MRVLLDLDGCLCDFVNAACRMHSQPNPYLLDKEFHGYDFVPRLDISNIKFWKLLDRQFWANLEWMSDGKKILTHLEERFGPENICILSSPCLTEGCVDGKIDWIRRELPGYMRRFLIGPDKNWCANSRTLLVDDREDNVNSFLEAGGQCILIPRPWNSRHSDDVMATLEASAF